MYLGAWKEDSSTVGRSNGPGDDDIRDEEEGEGEAVVVFFKFEDEL